MTASVKKISWWGGAAGLLLVFFIVGYILYPLLLLCFQGLPALVDDTEIISFRNIGIASFNSLVISLATVLGAAALGVWLAYTFTYRHFPLKSVLSALVLLPIATPPIAGVTAFQFLIGSNGLLSKLIGIPLDFSGWTAILIVHIYSFYPLFFLFAGAALRKMDNSIPEAAMMLGAGKARIFFTIQLPQLVPAMVSGAVLSFMGSMASFSAPFLYGGSRKFLTTEIYNAKINGDLNYAALLSLLLAVLAVVFLLLLNYYRRRHAVPNATKGAVKQVAATGAYNYGSWIMVVLFVIIVILPVLTLVLLSLLPDNALIEPALQYHFTLANFHRLFSEASFFEPFINSMEMAVVSVVATLLLSVIAAMVIRRKHMLGDATEVIVSLPYAIPGTVLALCFILAFNQPRLFSLGNILVGSYWILPLIYVVRNLPVLTQAASAGFAAIDKSTEEAAAMLGASPFKVFASVTLPALIPFLAEGCLLVFINAVGEFVATILLYTYGTRTISVEIYAQLRIYNNGVAAAYGVLLSVIVMIVVYWSRRIISERS